jgi:hypothetical protein
MLDVAICERREQAKKYPPGGGLNLFSWRKIEETYASCCIAQELSNDSS